MSELRQRIQNPNKRIRISLFLLLGALCFTSNELHAKESSVKSTQRRASIETTLLSQNLIEGLDLVSDKKVSVISDSNTKAFALIFLFIKCPCSASHIPRIIDLANEYKKLGVQFVG